ncbi:MAG TPA: hypothetical protein VKR53_03005, partial [Puia sp.]|nr:hypothetical protein [Puia sp.]
MANIRNALNSLWFTGLSLSFKKKLQRSKGIYLTSLPVSPIWQLPHGKFYGRKIKPADLQA